MKKQSVILSLAMLVFFFGAGMAGATCVQVGKVARLRAGSVGNFVDIQPLSNLPAFNTFFAVTNGLFYTLLGNSLGAHTTVEVTGGAPSCPTTGTFRNGGTVTAVDLLPNQ